MNPGSRFVVARHALSVIPQSTACRGITWAPGQSRIRQEMRFERPAAAGPGLAPQPDKRKWKRSIPASTNP